MAGLSVCAVLQKFLPKFDEELLDYITAIVEEMSLEEKRSHNSLHEVMGPFIVDTGKLWSKNRTAMTIVQHFENSRYTKGAQWILDIC